MAKDREKVNQKVGTLRDVFVKKLGVSFDELKQLINQLNPTSSLQQNQLILEQLMALLHKLKGSSGTFGLTVLSGLAKNMERQAITLFNQASPLQQETIAGLYQLLNLLIKEHDSGKNKNITDDPMWVVPEISETQSQKISKTIIIVDDDADLGRLLEMQLANFGFKVITLTNHKHLEKAITLSNPAVVIMDVIFPGEMDTGVNAVQELRNRSVLNCPVIFISVRGDLPTRLSAIRVGCEGYLCKPINVNNLIDILSQVTQINIEDDYRVLVIDDDPEEAKLNALLLHEAGIVTRVVTNPMETMTLMRELNPDVVLMDISMPECNGFELAEVIRQHSQYTQTPIIFLTASDMEDDWLKAMLAGGDEYLNKNISHKELVASVLARATRSRQLSTMIGKLRMSENRFRSVSASARDAIITSNYENRIVTWNRGAQRLFGYLEHEILGCDISKLFTESEMQYFKGDFETIEMEGVSKDGSQFPIEVSMAVWQVDQLSFFTVIIRNMIQRKRYEKSINDARQLAENANLAKSKFLAAMSHELRTPLHGILGFSQMLEQNQEEPLSKLQKKCVDHIHNSGQHLLGLIDDVLDLAKIEAGKVDIVLVDIDIHDLLEECIELAQPMADKYLVKIEALQNSCSTFHIYGDSARTKQVLLNLLSNAAKYNHQQGQVSIEYEEVCVGMLRISVTDTGIGIARDKWPELFKPFSRLGAETSEIEGTGIGLSVTKNLVEMMGGNIGFQSAEGQGSTFWVELPLSVNVEQQPLESLTSGDQKNLVDSEFPVINGTLLYVEDNTGNLMLMKMLVENISVLSMISATTAEQGIEMVKQTPSGCDYSGSAFAGYEWL